MTESGSVGSADANSKSAQHKRPSQCCLVHSQCLTVRIVTPSAQSPASTALARHLAPHAARSSTHRLHSYTASLKLTMDIDTARVQALRLQEDHRRPQSTHPALPTHIKPQPVLHQRTPHCRHHCQCHTCSQQTLDGTTPQPRTVGVRDQALQPTGKPNPQWLPRGLQPPYVPVPFLNPPPVHWW
jgi:hypothetical protein